MLTHAEYAKFHLETAVMLVCAGREAEAGEEFLKASSALEKIIEADGIYKSSAPAKSITKKILPNLNFW